MQWLAGGKIYSETSCCQFFLCKKSFHLHTWMEVCQHLGSGCFDPNILAVNILLLTTNEPLQRECDIQKSKIMGNSPPKICSRLLNSLSWLYCKMFLKFLWDFLKPGGKTKGQMYRSPLSVKSEKAEKQLDCLRLGMWGWRAAALQSLQACSGSVKVQCLGTQHPSEQSHLAGCCSQSAHSVCVCVFSALIMTNTSFLKSALSLVACVCGEMFVMFHGGLWECCSAVLRLWKAVQDVAALANEFSR